MECPACPVTEEPYELDGPNQPRILPCGHTLSYAALEQILKSPDARRRTCPIDRASLKHTCADAYPTNFTMLEIIRGLKAASAPAPADHSAPSKATPVDTSAQDHLLAEYLQAAWNNQGDALGPTTKDLFGLDHLVDLGAAPAAAAAAAGRAHLDRAARQPPLALADVLPPSQRMSTAAWGVLESYYKLPSEAVVGGPANWGPLGNDGDGAAVLHGNLHDHGVLEPVALCCAATLSSGGLFQQNLSVDSFHAAAAGAAAEVRAAVVPHVALQLMPDVRPLLPRLHGFFTRPDGAAAGRERLWLAYDSGETSLAAHLDSRPTSAITTKAMVLILHQLASALEAMHRHRFATPVLHPLSLASIHLSDPGTPAAAARIMPYAHVPSGKAAPLSPIISMLETLCVPPETIATTGLMDEAKGDVWRAAAIAAVSIAGAIVFDCLDDERRGEESLLDAALTRLARRGDDRKVSTSLLNILKGCLQHDPNKRWTATQLQAALLSDAVDTLDLG